MIFARRDIYTACSDWQVRVRQEEVPLLVPRHRADDRCRFFTRGTREGWVQLRAPCRAGTSRRYRLRSTGFS